MPTVVPAEPEPQVLEALGTVTVGERVAYLVQWVNPTPRLALSTVQLSAPPGVMRPLLLAAWVRGVRPDAVE